MALCVGVGLIHVDYLVGKVCEEGHLAVRKKVQDVVGVCVSIL